MTLKLFTASALLALTACASQPEGASPAPASGGATRTLQDLNGSRIAMPVGLFLAGMDSDRDTQISRAEIEVGMAESFEASDTDGNGNLSPIEFEDWSRTYLGTEHSIPGRLHFDRDQDARISRGEFTTTFAEIEQRLDTDRDGALVRAELLVEINGVGVDPQAIRAQMEAEMRERMQGRVRELCQRGGRM